MVAEELDTNDLIKMMGGQDRFKEAIDESMKQGRTYSEAKKLLALELAWETESMSKGFIRGATRAQNRFGKRLY